MRIALLLLPSFAACASSAQPDSAISTDRPGLLYAANVVPVGSTQLELALPQVSAPRTNEPAGWRSGLGLQVRAGVVDGLELRLGGLPLALEGSELGPTDLELGAKLALSDRGPVALLATFTLPTASAPLSNGGPGSLLALIADAPLNDQLTGKLLLGWNRVEDSDGRSTDSALLGLLTSMSLSTETSGYVELVAQPSLDGGSDPLFAGIGFTRTLGNLMQLDISLDRALTDTSPAWFATAGFSVRF